MTADPDTPTAEAPAQPQCNGICVMGHEVLEGAPAGSVAYSHPDCELHSRPPTADAPTDTDLAESIKRDVQDALFALNAERQDQGWHEGMIPGVIEVSRLVSAAVLPLVRAQVEAAWIDGHEKGVIDPGSAWMRAKADEVEAARRDALNEAADEWPAYHLKPSECRDLLRDRAARGETRQP